ncbi:MAG TPA: flippase [Methanobacteriales archaeon]|nr:flippase [Methanobacteriaceae archaeon]MBC7096107.1 flippase [Methanobacteriales archaeon]HIH62055.1 flippase [Methanobacteriales archaeon]
MSLTSSTSKLVKGSFLIMVSSLIFRVGGYIYRVFMTRLLGPEGYGLLGLTFPLQGIFQILSAGGLPPAIAKYVAQHKALNEDQMATQVLHTSLKLMIILGLSFSIIIFFLAPWLANDVFHKPLSLYPIQAVSLITPFSVIVGAFRGAFQGIYRMEYVVVTRAIEQIFMIIFAVLFVMIGFYAAGAVIGTGFGFIASAISAVVIYEKLLKGYLPPVDPENKLNFQEELGLMKVLLGFSIPVIITALSEMAIYDISVFAIGIFLATKAVGYYTAADPIARLPLIISLSVATAVLPATSEASALKDNSLLETYVVQSYRLVMLFVLPLCIGIAIFSRPILELLFGGAFIYGAGALTILVVGMTFYTLFALSASIAQGIGHPRLPMYILLIGTLINLVLNIIMVPVYGIEGGALATTIATFIIMLLSLWKTFQITNVRLPYTAFWKITLASIITGIPLILIPNTITGLIIALIISSPIYVTALLTVRGFEKRDIRLMKRLSSRMGPLEGPINRLIDFIDRYTPT